MDSEPRASVRARWIINCAGLAAAALAALIFAYPRRSVPKLYFAKGTYFSLPGRAPFSHLIYPVPGASGHLGIHLTLDLGGSARFGPDLEWLETINPAEPDYSVDKRRLGAFVDSILAYWPALPVERLAPDYSGVRPKLSGRGEPARDFLILGPEDHGCPGLINLFGIESPGLTSCLALADLVAARVEI